MSRFIDADLMREKAYQMNFDRRINERELFLFNRALSEMPTVDAVPVVRCKDCVYKKCVNDSNGEGLEYCGLMFCIITDNFYCGHGERKEGAV